MLPPRPSAGTQALFGMPNIRPLRVNDEGLNSLAAEWRSWRQLWDVYTVITGLDKKPNDFQASMFIASVGADALTIVNVCRTQDKRTGKTWRKYWTWWKDIALVRKARLTKDSSLTQGARVTESLAALRTLVRTCYTQEGLGGLLGRNDPWPYHHGHQGQRGATKDSNEQRRWSRPRPLRWSAGLLTQLIDKPLIWPQDRPEARCDTRKWRKYVEWGNAERRQGRAARMRTGPGGTNVNFAAKDINAGCAIVLQQAKHACAGRQIILLASADHVDIKVAMPRLAQSAQLCTTEERWRMSVDSATIRLCLHWIPVVDQPKYTRIWMYSRSAFVSKLIQERSVTCFKRMIYRMKRRY